MRIAEAANGSSAADLVRGGLGVAQTANGRPRPPGMAWLDDYMRIPFRDRGRGRQTGCDCYGWVRLILWEQAGVELPAFDALENGRRAETIAREASMLIPILPGEERRFDFVVLRSVDGTDSHLGIVTRQGWLGHTEVKTGPVHIPFDDRSVRHRIRQIYRHRALA